MDTEMKAWISRSLLAATLLLMTLPGIVGASEWDYELELFLQGAGLEGTVGIGPREADVDLSFSDILDNLEFGAMTTFRATKERWAVLVDAIYFATGNTTERADVDVDQLLLELDLVYRVNDVFGFFLGGRYIDASTEVDFLGPVGLQADRSDSWIDPVVGVAMRTPMSERWTFSGRLDAGGFGVGSDSTWQARVRFGYRASERITAVFGYQILDFDYEDGDGLQRSLLDLQTSGPTAGLVIHF
jgi:hypothetical protein